METINGKTNTGTDKPYVADSLYTVQLVIPDVRTKFQNPRSSSSREIFDENFHINYIGVRDRKREK